MAAKYARIHTHTHTHTHTRLHTHTYTHVHTRTHTHVHTHTHAVHVCQDLTTPSEFCSEPLKHHPDLHDFRPRKFFAELAHPNVTPNKYVLEKARIQNSLSSETFEGCLDLSFLCMPFESAAHDSLHHACIFMHAHTHSSSHSYMNTDGLCSSTCI